MRQDIHLAKIPIIPQKIVRHQPPTINWRIRISLYRCPQPSLKEKHASGIRQPSKWIPKNKTQHIVPTIITNTTQKFQPWTFVHQPSTINHQPSTINHNHNHHHHHHHHHQFTINHNHHQPGKHHQFRPQQLQLPCHGRSFLLSFAQRLAHGAQPLHPPHAAVEGHRGKCLAAKTQELLTRDGPKEGHGMAKPGGPGDFRMVMQEGDNFGELMLNIYGYVWVFMGIYGYLTAILLFRCCLFFN